MTLAISPAVVIEVLPHNTGSIWRVRLGKRAINFHEEQAARAFAAQLHIRMQWLQKPGV